MGEIITSASVQCNGTREKACKKGSGGGSSVEPPTDQTELAEARLTGNPKFHDRGTLGKDSQVHGKIEQPRTSASGGRQPQPLLQYYHF